MAKKPKRPRQPKELVVKKKILLFIGVVFAVIAIIGLTYIETFIGMVTIEGIAGTITAVNLILGEPSDLYTGYYGLFVQVFNVSVSITETATGGTIKRKDLIFDCVPATTEIYVSDKPESQLSLFNVTAATVADIVSYFNLTNYSRQDHPNATFTETANITIGNNTITTIGVYTFKNDAGGSTEFLTAALKDINGNVFFWISCCSSVLLMSCSLFFLWCDS